MDYQSMALEILENIGGTVNVKEVLHCATRLRFDLVDKSLVNEKNLEKIEGVQGVVFRTDQLQLIIGQGAVDLCYKEIQSLRDNSKKHSTGVTSVSKKISFNPKNLFNLFLETLSSIFAPIIPAIVGSGMIMGILYSLQTLGWADTSLGIFEILNVFSNAAFYFLPMYLAFSSAKRFGCNPYVAAVLGAILIHPTFIDMLSNGNNIIDLWGIKIVLQNYSSSVVPIILSVYFMSWVEKILKRIVPQMIDIIVTPTLSVFISGVVALWILAPLGQYIGTFVAGGLTFIYNELGFLGGILIGGMYPFILATGMQVAFSPITVLNLQSLGYDFIYPLTAASNSAMAAAALYLFFRTKDKKVKSIAGSTGISALIGVTEPVLFGVVLKYKKILYAVMGGGAIGGCLMGLLKVRYNGFGFVPFGTIILALGPTFTYYLIGVAVSMVTTVLILMWLDRKGLEEHTLNIIQPVLGRVYPLEDVSDPTFSKGFIGEGVAILPEPKAQFVSSPIDGEITAVFPTNHAIGITSSEGLEILIHVGIDTVNMNGEGFDTLVANGDKVSAGDKLLKFDVEKIKSAGFDPTICVVVTNQTEFDIQTDCYNEDNIIMQITKK